MARRARPWRRSRCSHACAPRDRDTRVREGGWRESVACSCSSCARCVRALCVARRHLEGLRRQADAFREARRPRREGAAQSLLSPPPPPPPPPRPPTLQQQQHQPGDGAALAPAAATAAPRGPPRLPPRVGGGLLEAAPAATQVAAPPLGDTTGGAAPAPLYRVTELFLRERPGADGARARGARYCQGGEGAFMLSSLRRPGVVKLGVGLSPGAHGCAVVVPLGAAAVALPCLPRARVQTAPAVAAVGSPIPLPRRRPGAPSTPVTSSRQFWASLRGMRARAPNRARQSTAHAEYWQAPSRARVASPRTAAASPRGPPLRVGDILLAINNVSVVGHALEEVRAHMRPWRRSH